MLEVFVNGRTAISTRLYAAEENVGIRFFADEEEVSASWEGGESPESKLLYATVWDGIGA